MTAASARSSYRTGEAVVPTESAGSQVVHPCGLFLAGGMPLSSLVANAVSQNGDAPCRCSRWSTGQRWWLRW